MAPLLETFAVLLGPGWTPALEKARAAMREGAARPS